MPILWGYECRPLGGGVCVPSQPQRGCEVLGDTCTNHYAGGDDPMQNRNEDDDQQMRADWLEHLYLTEQICRLE